MLRFFYLLATFISLTVVSHVQCDYFTSVAGLEELLVLESFWVNNFENYIEAIEKSNDVLRKYLDKIDGIFKEFVEEPTFLYEDPLNGLTSIKRIVSDWKVKERLVLNPEETEEYAKNLTKIDSELLIALPTYDDLNGAAKGIARLQRTFALKTNDVANGELLNIKYSPPMSANLCFYMGRSLYDAKLNELAIEWLIEARARMKPPTNDTNFENFFGISDMAILEFLGPAFFNIGNYKMAAKINEELLQKYPTSKYGLENKSLFDNKILEERDKKFETNYSMSVPDPELKITPIYEGVCRGELTQTPAEKRNLRCRYVSNNVPFCILAPFQMEELSLDPKVSYYHNSIYDSEIKKIIEFGEENVERSKVGDLSVSTFSDIRTGKNTWLWYDQHPFLDAISQRLVDITGLSLESAEPLQVATYGIGGHYGPHHDFSEKPDAYEDKGNRIATALFYISEVELGGGTAFPYLRLVVPPVRGSLVVWYNMHESLELDYRTLHAGCPVLKGLKWVCNEWFHENKQEFRRPCSLQLQGNRSIAYKNFDFQK